MAAVRGIAPGVVAVARALQIMEAFKPGERELARRTGLHKTTVLRIGRTLGAGR